LQQEVSLPDRNQVQTAGVRVRHGQLREWQHLSRCTSGHGLAHNNAGGPVDHGSGWNIYRAIVDRAGDNAAGAVDDGGGRSIHAKTI
jgi:hypothetical protein